MKSDPNRDKRARERRETLHTFHLTERQRLVVLMALLTYAEEDATTDAEVVEVEAIRRVLKTELADG